MVLGPEYLPATRDRAASALAGRFDNDRSFSEQLASEAGFDLDLWPLEALGAIASVVAGITRYRQGANPLFSSDLNA